MFLVYLASRFLLLARHSSSRGWVLHSLRASVEVGLATKGLAGLDGLDRAKYSFSVDGRGQVPDIWILFPHLVFYLLL